MCLYSPFCHVHTPSTLLPLGTCMIPSHPGQAYKRANLLQSFLVPPEYPSHKQELPIVPGTEVSAQVLHLNSLDGWLDWVGLKTSTRLTEELSVDNFFLKLWIIFSDTSIIKQKSLGFEQCLCCEIVVPLRTHVPDLPWRGTCERKMQYLQM